MKYRETELRMDRHQLSQFLRYVVATVCGLDGFVTTIRLVKFVYLIDLEHWRRYGRTLTGLPWLFHHYGPYAFEFGHLGRLCGYDLEHEEFVNARGHRGTLLHTDEDAEFPEGLRPTARMIVDGLLEKWADVDTDDLLDYVYHTEPIRRGQRGHPLDWHSVRRGTRYYQIMPPRIPEAEARRLRELMGPYSEAEEEVSCIPPTRPSATEAGQTRESQSAYSYTTDGISGALTPSPLDALHKGLADLDAWDDTPEMPEGTIVSLPQSDIDQLISDGDA